MSSYGKLTPDCKEGKLCHGMLSSHMTEAEGRLCSGVASSDMTDAEGDLCPDELTYDRVSLSKCSVS